MKKILFFCTRYPGLGGIEKVTEYLANELCIDYSISIFSVYPLSDKMLLNNLDQNVKYFEQKNNLSDDLLQVINNEHIDCIIYQDSYYGKEDDVFAAIRMANKRPKLIIVEHNTPNCYLLSNKFHYGNTPLALVKRFGIWLYSMKRHRKMYKNTDKYVLLSKRFIPIFKYITCISNPTKLTYINNPVTCQKPDNVVVDLDNKEKLCLFSGRLVPQKSVHLLVEVWNRISKMHPDWKLEILGDGEKLEWMKLYVDKNNLHESVSFEGFQTNVVSYYKRASILTMSSIYEGWLLSLCESMYYGVCPILFSSYEAAFDIIDDDKNGVLVDAFSVEQYVERLDALMSNPSKLKAMQKAAVSKSENFSIQSISKQWRDLLNDL